MKLRVCLLVFLTASAGVAPGFGQRDPGNSAPALGHVLESESVPRYNTVRTFFIFAGVIIADPGQSNYFINQLGIKLDSKAERAFRGAVERARLAIYGSDGAETTYHEEANRTSTGTRPGYLLGTEVQRTEFQNDEELMAAIHSAGNDIARRLGEIYGDLEVELQAAGQTSEGIEGIDAFMRRTLGKTTIASDKPFDVGHRIWERADIFENAVRSRNDRPRR